MKKRVSISLLLVLFTTGLAFADIQSSYGMKWNWSRKLSRAIGNIAYGPAELLSTWARSNRYDGSSTAAMEGPVEGTKRGCVRIGYGVYELLTFPVHSYKGTYRPPFYKKSSIDPWYGYSEFPPQIGIQSQSNNVRSQVW